MKIIASRLVKTNITKVTVRLCLVTLGLISNFVSAQNSESVSPQRALLNQYCVSCHNQAMVSSLPVEGENLLFTQLRGLGLTLDIENVDDVSENPEVWELSLIHI